MSLRSFILTIVVQLAFMATSHAAPAAYKFDKGHADIGFSISHLGYSMVNGRFQEFEGELVLDRDDPAKSQVSVTILTHSVNTGFDARDRHLRAADFFHVAKFPVMTFVSKSVKVSGRDKSKADVQGDLTLLGVTKSVTLQVTLNKSAPNPRSNVMTAGFTANGSIKRSEFGMNYGLPGLADDVAIIINIEATENAKAP